MGSLLDGLELTCEINREPTAKSRRVRLHVLHAYLCM